MATHLPFKYHPAAVIEAREAFQWYHNRSPDAAERFWNELVRARRMIVAHPQLWSPYLEGTRCFRLQKFPYGLIYLEHPELIYGIAVAHLHREPFYWKQRIE